MVAQNLFMGKLLQNLLTSNFSCIHTQILSNDYLYLFYLDFSYNSHIRDTVNNSGFISIPMIITRCDKTGNEESVASNYFGNVGSAFVDNTEIENLAGNITSYNGSNFTTFMKKNLHYINSSNKIFIYFLQNIKPEYIKINDNFYDLINVSQGSSRNNFRYNYNNTQLSYNKNTHRLFKLEIDFNQDFTQETHKITKAYTFNDNSDYCKRKRNYYITWIL